MPFYGTRQMRYEKHRASVALIGQRTSPLYWDMATTAPRFTGFVLMCRGIFTVIRRGVARFMASSENGTV